MSSSSDEGEHFQLRDYDEDSEDERPNKRRKTMRPLRGKGIGFVSSTAQVADDDEKEEDEDDIDDEKPTIGLGMGGARSSFGIGEYSGQVDPSLPPERDATLPGDDAPRGGTGPSAFGAGGKVNKMSFAARMMAKQGYVEGQGLGKSSQGIAAPIQAIGTANRAGLGTGTASQEPRRKQQKEKRLGSKASTPGTSTPKIKAPPKPKYTVAAIESRGLHVPEAIKSVIIDATGTKTKAVSSLSGFSTPTREDSPSLESTKASSRLKLQLQAYAEAWDSTTDALTRLESEEANISACLALYSEEGGNYASLIGAFERVSADDSAQTRPWPDIVTRLQKIQESYASYIEELDLPFLAVSCLEAPFRTQLLNWNPLDSPEALTVDLKSISTILDVDKSISSHNIKRTTPYSTLLLSNWYPHVRAQIRAWSIYNPDPAFNLISAWKHLLPPWLTYKFLSELIIPRLIDGVRHFPKLVLEISNGTSATRRTIKDKTAPDLHSWLFDWWSLLSSPELDFDLFPMLRSAVKEKVDSTSWPLWKPLLGTKKPIFAPTPTSKSSIPSATPTIHNEVSFKDQVEEWCAENNLVLRSTNRSDTFGRLLYRLQDADRRSKGILVYLLEDVVFGEDGQPFGLDEVLLDAALG